jgi:glycosyltransferase involved in cell wall biosynthesis
MRILQVHNFYQRAGGEDRVVAAEHALLASNGHEVLQYTVHNKAVNDMAAFPLGLKTVWNQQTYRNVRSLIADERVELVHVHNTMPLISPAVYYAAAAKRTPIVQTLHNYRLLCPAATFYRQGEVCETCLGKTIKYPAIQHRCYRHSLPASGALSAMLAAHHLSGTYQKKIHTYIVLTEFARAKFCAGGLPAERLTVKPNFLADDPGTGTGQGGYALYAGRLDEEKGLATLLAAWSTAPQAIPLKIAGDGPLRGFVSERAAALPNVEYLGYCDHAEVIRLLQDAAFLVFPSRWYEGMPIIVLESMACGTPVVAFGLGSLNHLIIDNVNGIKLAFPDASALPHFLNHGGELVNRMDSLRSGARKHFEEHFTAQRNYGLLLDIYNRALSQPHSLS